MSGRGGARGGGGNRGNRDQGQRRGRGGAREGGGGGQRGGRDGGGRGGGGGGGRGDYGDRGRGGGSGRGRGGGNFAPPARGQASQMAVRGPPPADQTGGIFAEGQPVPAPDPAITAAEDAYVQVTRGRQFEFTTKVKDRATGVERDITKLLPGRRSYATRGRSTVLRTNYFQIKATADQKTWYKYSIAFILPKKPKKSGKPKTGAPGHNNEPDLSSAKKRRVVESLLQRPPLQGLNPSTDYANVVITTSPLNLAELPGPSPQVWEEDVVIPPPQGNQGQSNAPAPTQAVVQEARNRNTVRMRVKLDQVITMGNIIDFLSSTAQQPYYAALPDVVQTLNIIMSKRPQDHESVARVGQNKFYPFGNHPAAQFFVLGGGLEALRGYYSSVRPANHRLLLNLNVSSGAFYRAIKVADLIRESGLDRRDEQEAFIKLLRVRVEYKKDGASTPHMTKIKTIFGFAPRPARFGHAQQVRFQYEDRTGAQPQTRDVTVFAYFKNVHGITLQQQDPVLNVGTREDPQYVPMELCTVLPGQAYRRMLGGNQTAEMITFAARPPNQNAMSIAGLSGDGNALKVFQLTTSGQELSIKPFGLELGVQMITVPGRILGPPQLKYGNKSEVPRFGTWNLINLQFNIPGTIGNWQVLIINRQGNRGDALQGDPTQVLADFQRALATYKIRTGQRLPNQTILLNPLTFNNRDHNDRIISKAFEKASELGVKMLLVVLPEADRWMYARIKIHGDVLKGIHSVCVVGNKLQKPKGQDMYMANVALKINIKGGGVSHTITNVLTKPLDKDTMLMGLDVTHPSPGSSSNAPSIAAVVASIDEHLCQWPGSIRKQRTAREEMIQGLDEMVIERLTLWEKKHQGRSPSKIVVYRDGVSEGQYPIVLDKELPAFHQAFKQKYGKEERWPKMAIIVVGKRHHTRFYPTNKNDADQRSWNPLPGTVVDRGIAGKILHEFWLQAHQGIQGTARPAHYVVIKDDIGFEADQLEQFTHSLCYLFNRATKAVSICPPAYYADLLCERGRYYLYSELQENNAIDDATSVSTASEHEWSGGVHENLKDSTWYI